MAKRGNPNPPPPPVEHQFKPGQSGNPGGKAVNARNKIQTGFLNALAKDFEAHGEEAIRLCRETKPQDYVRVCAALLPKEVNVTTPLDELDNATLDAVVSAVRSILAAQGVGSGAETTSIPKQAH